jgi:hypothetical protein
MEVALNGELPHSLDTLMSLIHEFANAHHKQVLSMFQSTVPHVPEKVYEAPEPAPSLRPIRRRYLNSGSKVIEGYTTFKQAERLVTAVRLCTTTIARFRRPTRRGIYDHYYYVNLRGAA